MPVTTDKVLGVPRSRLYVYAGMCFIVAGVARLFDTPDGTAKWLAGFGFVWLGCLYIFIQLRYHNKNQRITATTGINDKT